MHSLARLKRDREWEKDGNETWKREIGNVFLQKNFFLFPWGLLVRSAQVLLMQQAYWWVPPMTPVEHHTWAAEFPADGEQKYQSLRGTFKGNLSMWPSTLKRQVLRQRNAPLSSCACVVPSSASRAWVSVSNAPLCARVTRRHQCMPASGVVLRIREGAGHHESFSPVQNQCHNAEKKKASAARPSQRNATVLRTLPFFFCPHSPQVGASILVAMARFRHIKFFSDSTAKV